MSQSPNTQPQVKPPADMVANQAQWHDWLLSPHSPHYLKQLDAFTDANQNAAALPYPLPMATVNADKMLQYDDLLQGGVAGAIEGLFSKTVAVLTGLFGAGQVAKWVFAYRTRYPNPSPYFPPMFAQWPGFLALLPELKDYPVIPAMATAEWCYLQARLAPNARINAATYSPTALPPVPTMAAVWNPAVIAHSFLYPIPTLWQQWPKASATDVDEWTTADWQAWLANYAQTQSLGLTNQSTPLLFCRNPQTYQVRLLATNPVVGGLVAAYRLNTDAASPVSAAQLNRLAERYHGQGLPPAQWEGLCSALQASGLLLGWQ